MTGEEPSEAPIWFQLFYGLLRDLVIATRSGDKDQERKAFHEVLRAIKLLVEQLPKAAIALEQERADAARQALVEALGRPTPSALVVREAAKIWEEEYERFQREEAGEEPAT